MCLARLKSHSLNAQMTSVRRSHRVVANAHTGKKVQFSRTKQNLNSSFSVVIRVKTTLSQVSDLTSAKIIMRVNCEIKTGVSSCRVARVCLCSTLPPAVRLWQQTKPLWLVRHSSKKEN